MTKDDIVIYSTHTCGYCNALKAWLDDNKVEYTDKYIDTDDEAQAELMAKIGGNIQVVPVTFIKDVKIEGFNRNQFATVLKDNGIEITDL
jgi:glutaredoxin